MTSAAPVPDPPGRSTRIVSTTVVLALLLLLGTALIPRERGPAAQPPSALTSPAAASAEAAGPVAAPGTPACPVPDSAGGGALHGVTVGCLGSTAALDLGAALAGRPVLVNVWASWCAPCRDEIPVLSAYARETDAVEVLGLNVQDQTDVALALLSELDPGYPSAVDIDGTALAALQAPAVLPLSYLVRADGTVVRITDPPVLDSVPAVRSAVRVALG